MSRPSVTMIIGSALRGGAEGQAVRVARGLASDRFDVRMLFMEGGGPHTASLDADGVPWDIVSSQRDAAFGLRRLHATVSLLRLLRSHRPDVVIAWMHGAISTIPIFTPVVGAATIAAFRGVAEKPHRGRRRRALARLGTRWADCVTINSPTLEAEALAWGAAGRPIRLLPNGVDLPPRQ